VTEEHRPWYDKALWFIDGVLTGLFVLFLIALIWVVDHIRNLRKRQK